MEWEGIERLRARFLPSNPKALRYVLRRARKMLGLRGTM